MGYTLKGKMCQCPLCDRVFSSDNGCERHKPYATPKTAECKDPASLGMIEGDRGWKVPIPEELQYWKTDRPVVERPAFKTLTCKGCGAEWERPSQRGRLPHFCPTCDAERKVTPQ